ncbi:LysR family transcriptional regulator [Lachnospiraceae bacterium ZAX-1]
MMNWQQLIYFQIVAELQNYTRAAEQLYITPSALNKSIRHLENDLGFPLFEKQGRSVNLTDYGRIFYKYVVNASFSIESGMYEIHEKMGLTKGRITITGIYTMCADYLPQRIKKFKKLHPDVTFAMEYNITSKILDKVLSGSCDLGFCGDYDLADESYQGICRKLIKVEELIIIVPKDHRLANEEYIDFGMLGNEDFIIYRNVNSGISYIFWRLCKEAGITPRIAFEVPDDHSILGLVSVGLGIALIADSESLRTDNVRAIPFKGEKPIRNQYMIWKKDRFESLVAQAFRLHIIEDVSKCE